MTNVSICSLFQLDFIPVIFPQFYNENIVDAQTFGVWVDATRTSQMIAIASLQRFLNSIHIKN